MTSAAPATPAGAAIAALHDQAAAQVPVSASLGYGSETGSDSGATPASAAPNQSSITTDEAGVVEDAGLVRGGFFAWASDACNRVITRAIQSFSLSGKGSLGIEKAVELYDQTGENGLIWREIAFLLMQRGGEVAMPRFVLDCVLKGHLDGKVPDGWQGWDVPRSYPLRLSAQPGMRWESFGRAEPGTLFGPSLQSAGNPGSPLEAISGDMVVVQDGLPYREILIDGKPWLIPIVGKHN
jgi:hypothetical protein